MSEENGFKQKQLMHSRVQNAYREKEIAVKNYFKAKNISFESYELFLRAFKKEQALEVWIKEKGKDQYILLTTYEFCTSSGTLGPKRKEGDLQIPEGIYYINHSIRKVIFTCPLVSTTQMHLIKYWVTPHNPAARFTSTEVA
jgi:murein L,D-transpeptidase YafK